MPAVPDRSKPMTLTNPYNGSMELNVQTANGLYLIDALQLEQTVRSTKDNVPQSDGSILHHRFLTGSEMTLNIQLWEDASNLACDELLVTMVDELTGAFRSLLNAGDNEGRIDWDVDGQPVRMLDDIRLLVYPVLTQGPAASISVTVDSQYPYAQNLEQESDFISDGGTAILTNTGTADYFPVFQVDGPTSAFTLSNLTTGIDFVYNSSLNGAVAIGGGDYAEIDTFRNTIFLNGNGANLKAGVYQLDSDYWSLVVGANNVGITGADVTVLWAPAWG